MLVAEVWWNIFSLLLNHDFWLILLFVIFYYFGQRLAWIKVLEGIFLEWKNRNLPATCNTGIGFNLHNFGMDLFPIIFVNFKTPCWRVSSSWLENGSLFKYIAVRLKWTHLIWTIGYSERYAIVPIETLFIKLNG